MTELIEIRSQRVSPEAREILYARGGRRFDSGLAVSGRRRRNAGGPGDEWGSELAAAGLVRAGEAERCDSYLHEIVRDAAQRILPADRLSEVHALVAKQLQERAYSSHTAGELSHHLAYSTSAEDKRRAVDYAVVAGDAALAALAPTLAARHFAAALELADQARPALTPGDRCDLTMSSASPSNTTVILAPRRS